jgi:hypothetical protein
MASVGPLRAAQLQNTPFEPLIGISAVQEAALDLSRLNRVQVRNKNANDRSLLKI